ncbi:MAG: PQQ-binding-like beta-propeller repeat protein [Planctomycetota bacterium]
MRRWPLILGMAAAFALLVASGAARTGQGGFHFTPESWIVLDDLDRLARVGLAGSPSSRIAYLKSLGSQPAPQAVEKALDLLESDDFASREEAERQLSGCAVAAVLALKPRRDPETKARLERCAEAWKARTDPLLLGAIGRSLVRQPADGSAAAIRTALAVITDADSAEPLHQALESLGQPDTGGPGRAAFAKVRAGDASALPGLIGALEAEPEPFRIRVLEYLYRLADDDAPAEPWSADAGERAAAKEAWLQWAGRFAKSGKPSIPGPPAFRDRTLVVLLDLGQVAMLDSSDKPLWSIRRVDFPLDAEPLPGNRVLLAENKANRVVIRSRTGAVLWEHAVDSPLVAQSVEEDRVFVASRTELFEVDRSGRRVRSWSRPDDETYMRAMRLPDGGLAVVTFRQRFVQMDQAGLVIRAFPVMVTTSGGRIDVAPDGRVLVPMMTQDRVVEYSGNGDMVRSFLVTEPIVAQRLPSGHVMVTSMDERMAVEFDATGRRIWRFDSPAGRLTRAVRH